MSSQTHPASSRALRLALAASLALTALLGAAAAAHAESTGDLIEPPADELTAAEAAMRQHAEEQSETPAPYSGPGAQYNDAPYRFLYTPTHEQETRYFCGPATVQVIDDYFGAYAPQSVIAAFMGTTPEGTAFTKVDDALRHFTDRQYYYYGNLTKSAFLSRVEHSILAHSQPLAADVRIVASTWPHYNFDHAGHIVPIEGFDWRHGLIRLNDVYQESRWRRGGGDTLGHTTYGYQVVWDGVYRHFLRAVVSAP